MLDFSSCFFEKWQPAHPFEDDEESMTSLLHNKADDNLDEAYDKMDDFFGGKSVRNWDKIEQAIILIAPILSVVQNHDINLKYESLVDTTIYKGALKAGAPQSINYALLKDSVKDGIVKASGYYTNKYFNTIVVPKVQKAALDAIDKQASSRHLYDEVRKSIDDHYGSVKYWQLVANNSASRAFHYGLCKGGTYTGHSAVRFDAIMDDRTSKICSSMNGTTWNLYDVVNILESATTGNPEDWEHYTPWLSTKEFLGLNKDELVERGVICPPLHGRCRSVLQLV